MKSMFGLLAAFVIFVYQPSASAAELDPQDEKELVNEVLAVRTDVRKQADLVNDVLKSVNTNNAAINFLKALNVHFKVFEGGTNKAATLGVEYNFDKSIVGRELGEKDNAPVLTLSLRARGNVAFDKERNPNDFLETGGSLHMWQLFGGDAETLTVGADKMTARSRTHQMFANDPRFAGKTGAEIRASEEWKNYKDTIYERDPADLFYDLAANFALESNQTFSKKQYAYGGSLQPRARVWDPRWGMFNILDWPFAATRAITTGKFEPKGRYLPSPMIGIDLVDGGANPDRRAVDPANDTFPRVKAEIAFRSKVLDIDLPSVGKTEGARNPETIWFNASFRYFRELGASDAIKTANLAESRYWALSLELPLNLMVTYTTGRLPFDRKDDQVWAIGYHFHF